MQRVSSYDRIFKMVNAERCDLFPRAIYEALAEINSLSEQYPSLMFMDEHILTYKFPLYFFVRHSDESLDKQLEHDLMAAVADASFDNLLRTPHIVRPIYPLAQWRKKQFIQLENLLLSKETPKEGKYWLRLK